MELKPSNSFKSGCQTWFAFTLPNGKARFATEPVLVLDEPDLAAPTPVKPGIRTTERPEGYTPPVRTVGIAVNKRMDMVERRKPVRGIRQKKRVKKLAELPEDKKAD